MYGYVYLITNLITNKIYVGIHKYDKPELDKRYHGSGAKLQESYSEYGLDNHVQEILDIADDRLTLKYLEHFWIALLDSNNPEIGLNMNHGGGGTAQVTDDTKVIISQTSYDRWKDSEYKNRVGKSISKSLTGHAVSKSTRYKISQTKKGTVAWNKGLKGCYTKSEESKQKTSESVKDFNTKKYIENGFADYYQTHTDFQCRAHFGQISKQRFEEILQLLNLHDSEERQERIKQIIHERRSNACKQREERRRQDKLNK